MRRDTRVGDEAMPGDQTRRGEAVVRGDLRRGDQPIVGGDKPEDDEAIAGDQRSDANEATAHGVVLQGETVSVNHDTGSGDEVRGRRETHPDDEVLSRGQRDGGDEVLSRGQTHRGDEVLSRGETHRSDEVLSGAETRRDDEALSRRETHRDDEVFSRGETHRDDEVRGRRETHPDDEVASARKTHRDDELRPIPTGRRSDFARWREVTYMLVLRDLKARSKQAYLGYLWILIQPLLLTGVFSFLVQQVLGRSDLSEIPYPVFLMAGVIPWQYFANSLNESAESLVKNVDLVRQVYFPREILAIYPVFARLVDVAVGCAALGVFMLVFHVPVSGWVVLVPVILIEEMLFAAACGLLLSAANVAWRDVSRGLPLVLFLMLYAVPVLYPPERVPAVLRPVFDLNPIAHLVDTFRAAVVGTHSPDLMGLAVLGVVGLVALLLAQRLFSIFDGVLADVI